LLSVIGWAAGSVLVLGVAIPLYGLLIAMQWEWFVAPIVNAPEITVRQGVGLSLFLMTAGWIATCHLQKWGMNEDDDPLKAAIRNFTRFIGIGIVEPVIGLALSWAWHAAFV
jgi:uncharacterized membrane protein (DUF485 family)